MRSARWFPQEVILKRKKKHSSGLRCTIMSVNAAGSARALAALLCISTLLIAILPSSRHGQAQAQQLPFSFPFPLPTNIPPWLLNSTFPFLGSLPTALPTDVASPAAPTPPHPGGSGSGATGGGGDDGDDDGDDDDGDDPTPPTYTDVPGKMTKGEL